MGKAVLLLGAGASIEFVKNPKLTSDFIMQQLQSMNTWNYLLSNDSINMESKPKVETILKLITENRKANDNFEDVIEVLDKVCTISNPHKYSDSLLVRSVNYVTDLTIENSSDRFELLNVPLYIRELIAEIVKEYNNALGEEPSIQQLIDLQQGFIECLQEKFNNISVHSLNYDDCILKSLRQLGFSTGFDELGYFHKFIYQSSNKVISYLHGTPHFVPKYKYFSGNSAIVKYYDNCEEASKERWRLMEIHPGLYSDGVAHPDYNHFITTGRDKDSHFYNQPYASYYTKLAEDLDNADLIFIIGYSFGDEHINQFLSSIRDNEYSKSIVIIDYDNRDDESYEEKTCKKIANIIIKLEKQYSEKAMNTSFANILRKLGDQNYAKIGDHDIYYYNKGYASFLNEDINDLIFNEFA